MRLPKTVRVGPHKFHIVEVDNAWRDSTDAQGQFLADAAIIYIVTEYRTTAHILDTALHEIGHAIWWTANLKDDDKEESIIHRMATGWAQVWIDNPDLLKFLNDSIRKIKREYGYSSPKKKS